MEKTALVLGGGGARGAYEVGVWKALRELQIPIDIVTGTSVGALNGALIAQDDFDTAIKMWENIKTDTVMNLSIPKNFNTLEGTFATIGAFIKEIFKNKGADTTPLKEMLYQCVNTQKLMQSEIDFGIVTVCLEKLNPCVLFKEDMNEEDVVDYLMASAACFPAMQSHKIGDGEYIDGGFHDVLPIQPAIDRGATNIIAVDINGIGIVRKLKLENNIKIKYIRSYWDLGTMLVFDGNAAKKNIALGYFDTLKAYGQYDGKAYTFYSEECKKNSDKLEPIIENLADQLNLSLLKNPLNPFENIFKLKIASALRKRWTKDKPELYMLITSAAEFAAEYFNISPEKVYSFDEFNNEITTHYREYLNKESAPIIDFLTLKTTEMNKIVDKGMIVCGFVKILQKALQDKNAIPTLMLWATVAPTYFCAAFYVYTISL